MNKETIKKWIAAVKLIWKEKGFEDAGILAGAGIALYSGWYVIGAIGIAFWAGINFEQIKQAVKK